MLTVYKYPVSLNDEFSVSMPQGAKILSVQTQRGIPQMWVLVDTDALEEVRHFRLVGTGHPIHIEHDRLAYIGTIQLHDLVFHLFEVVP